MMENKEAIAEAKAHAIGQGIMSLLPDNPHDAVAVLALVFANVVVATGCADENALTAVRVALRQMHEGMKM